MVNDVCLEHRNLIQPINFALCTKNSFVYILTVLKKSSGTFVEIGRRELQSEK